MTFPLNDTAYETALEAVFQYRSNTPVDTYTIRGEYAVFLAAYREANKPSSDIMQSALRDILEHAGEPECVYKTAKAALATISDQ